MINFELDKVPYKQFILNRFGPFEILLLKAIPQLGEDAYCVNLTEYLSQKHNRFVSTGQVSRTLNVLKRDKLLTSYDVRPDPKRRTRTVYEYTDLAIDLFKETN